MKLLIILLAVAMVASSSAEPPNKSFPIREGDISALEMTDYFDGKSHHYSIKVTLTKRRSLEWQLVALDRFGTDADNPTSGTVNYHVNVELSEGWVVDNTLGTPSAEDPMIHIISVGCDSLEDAVAKMKLLQAKVKRN